MVTATAVPTVTPTIRAAATKAKAMSAKTKFLIRLVGPAEGSSLSDPGRGRFEILISNLLRIPVFLQKYKSVANSHSGR
jgi:hypothetical protein